MYALVFPGQGSQEVGMGRELAERFSVARDIFAEADDALGFALGRVIFEGPDEELKKTALTQPAIMTASIAALTVLKLEYGLSGSPAFVAGHSLGEYTALVAAKVLSFADAVRLVHIRGALMQDAAPEGTGAMAAIIGLDDDAVAEICAEIAPNRECQPANFNAPGQVVVSGLAGAVQTFIETAKSRGARKAILLNVSAPFHSALMRGVADRLAAEFEKCSWSDASIPVVANVSALPVASVGDIRKSLYEQTYSPVLWSKSVECMADKGVSLFAEIGPGTVLSGLVKRCRKGLMTMSACTPESLEEVAHVLRKS
jgi:[acyl-carrier-protein] S-malonyltransferase